MMHPSPATEPTAEAKVAAAHARAKAVFGARVGRPVFLRLIKEDALLEMHTRADDGSWQLLKTYPIAAMGTPTGPKEAEGDGRSPEGFYAIAPRALNPRSNYHLSFNIGYPNRYDRSLGRTGSLIMVHGRDVSIGCFAMTDPGIEEIYGMVEAALTAGQATVPVQIYPFRMTPERMEQENDSPYFPFWQHLLPGWQHTERTGAPSPAEDGESQ